MATSTIAHIFTHSSHTDYIDIQIIDDSILEAHEEIFMAIMFTRDPGVSVKGNSTAVIIIQDNDGMLTEISEIDVNHALFIVVENHFGLYFTTFNLQEDCGYFNATITRAGTSALPIELVISRPSMTSTSSYSVPSLKTSIIFQPTQLTNTAIVPMIEEYSAENKTENNELSLILSVGPTSESLRGRLLLLDNQTLLVIPVVTTVKVVDITVPPISVRSFAENYSMGFIVPFMLARTIFEIKLL